MRRRSREEMKEEDRRKRAKMRREMRVRCEMSQGVIRALQYRPDVHDLEVWCSGGERLVLVLGQRPPIWVTPK